MRRLHRCESCAKDPDYHVREAARISTELDNLGPAFSSRGIVRTVLHERVQQEQRRAEGGAMRGAMRRLRALLVRRDGHWRVWFLCRRCQRPVTRMREDKHHHIVAECGCPRA